MRNRLRNRRHHRSWQGSLRVCALSMVAWTAGFFKEHDNPTPAAMCGWSRVLARDIALMKKRTVTRYFSAVQRATTFSVAGMHPPESAPRSRAHLLRFWSREDRWVRPCRTATSLTCQNDSRRARRARCPSGRRVESMEQGLSPCLGPHGGVAGAGFRGACLSRGLMPGG